MDGLQNHDYIILFQPSGFFIQKYPQLAIEISPTIEISLTIEISPKYPQLLNRVFSSCVKQQPCPHNLKLVIKN